MVLADSHCHLSFPELAGALDAVVGRMKEAEVAYALCVSVDLETFSEVHRIVSSFNNIFASAGEHPTHAPGATTDEDALIRAASAPGVVAVGETGLDYYRSEGDLEWQRKRFRDHIRVARKLGKPLIVHTRQAALDTLRLLDEEGAAEVGGVMHCFTDSWAVAEAALGLGFYISFSGIITFKNADALREVAKKVPMDRLLIETDAPYLAPVPLRGKRNEPAYVRYVAEQVAALRGVPLEALAAATTENFFRLFKEARRE
jgi:TatD DNase family protein